MTAALGESARTDRAAAARAGRARPGLPPRPRAAPARRGRRGAAGGAPASCAWSRAIRRWCRSPTCPAGCRSRRSSGTGPTCCPGWSTTTASGSCSCTPRSSARSCSGASGVHRLASGEVLGDDPLCDYGPHAAALVARVSSFPHCADVVINSRYDPATDEASPFEPHVGSHGGLGGPQQYGFLTYPRAWRPPGEIVGAEALHRRPARLADRPRPPGAHGRRRRRGRGEPDGASRPRHPLLAAGRLRGPAPVKGCGRCCGRRSAATAGGGRSRH